MWNVVIHYADACYDTTLFWFVLIRVDGVVMVPCGGTVVM